LFSQKRTKSIEDIRNSEKQDNYENDDVAFTDNCPNSSSNLKNIRNLKLPKIDFSKLSSQVL